MDKNACQIFIMVCLGKYPECPQNKGLIWKILQVLSEIPCDTVMIEINVISQF